MRDIARVIAEIIAEIIADPTFAFVITDEDDDVRVRWRGQTIRLGLLPDGSADAARSHPVA